MLKSKCPKCEGTWFETVLEKPDNSNFKIQFIRCNSCWNTRIFQYWIFNT